MTILIVDDLNHLGHYLERLAISTDATVVAINDFVDAYDEIAQLADRLTVETLAMVRESQFCEPGQESHFVDYLPGRILPRIVDNADRSGANIFKRVNATYGATALH